MTCYRNEIAGISKSVASRYTKHGRSFHNDGHRHWQNETAHKLNYGILCHGIQIFLQQRYFEEPIGDPRSPSYIPKSSRSRSLYLPPFFSFSLLLFPFSPLFSPFKMPTQQRITRFLSGDGSTPSTPSAPPVGRRAPRKKRALKNVVAPPQERISNWFHPMDQSGSTLGPQDDGLTTGPQTKGSTLGPQKQGSTLCPQDNSRVTLGPQQDVEMMVVDSEDESSPVSLGVSAQKSESSKKTSHSKGVIVVSPRQSPEKATSKPLKTPAKIAEVKLDNSFTPPPTEPRRSKCSAAAVAKSNIKRSYEATEEDATQVKKARKEVSAAASDVLRTGKYGRDIATLKTLELFEKYRTQHRVENAPTASLEKEKEDVVKLEESDYEEAGSVHSDYDGNKKSRTNRKIGNVSIDATQEDADESNREPIDIDPLDALVDDECIPLDDDEVEGDDENIAIEDDNAIKNDNDSPKPAQTRPHIQTTEVNAAQWVKECNETYHVDENDKDVRRFEESFAHVIYAICSWAKDIPDTWSKLPRKDREMSTSFYSLLKRAAVDPDSLLETVLQGIPLQTRKVLGKADLKATDLLDLPLIPKAFKHWLVYINIATELRDEQICQEKKFATSSKLYKVAKPLVNVKEASKTSLYVGSSIRKEGSWKRIQEHEMAANRTPPSSGSMHYHEISKSNVVTNFRVFGVWQNKYVKGSYIGQDTGKWIVLLVEGLTMGYLGLYTEQNAVTSGAGFCTPASYILVKHIRSGISLPDFSNVSLNRVWPLSSGGSK